jgi:hypothetical protein
VWFQQVGAFGGPQQQNTGSEQCSDRPFLGGDAVVPATDSGGGLPPLLPCARRRECVRCSHDRWQTSKVAIEICAVIAVWCLTYGWVAPVIWASMLHAIHFFVCQPLHLSLDLTA